MSNKSLRADNTPTIEERQPRSAVLTGWCTDAEKDAVLTAFGRSGWEMSHGIRTILLAFAESSEVRDAVFLYLRQRAA